MKNTRVRIVAALVLFLCFSTIHAQNQRFEQSVSLSWNHERPASPYDTSGSLLLSFSGSVLRSSSGLLPVFVLETGVNPGTDSLEALHITNTVFEPVPELVTGRVAGRDFLTPGVIVRQELTITRKIPSLTLVLVPLRLNKATGLMERLVSFTLSAGIIHHAATMKLAAAPSYAAHSVLATGNWYKFSASARGIYRLTYDDLKNAGLDVDGIDPRTIRLYGNGGGMLPEANSATRTDDLMENAIFVSGEDDGRFDKGDYVLFYAQSPDRWAFSSSDKLFHHQRNAYSDITSYFLTTGPGNGKRITDEPSTTKNATATVTQFEDYTLYEKDEANLIKSGREWWDKQYFDMTTSRTYSFSFPGIISTLPVTVRADVAARSTSGSTAFVISAQDQPLTSINISAVSGSFEDFYARRSAGTATFLTANPVIDITLTYNRSSTSAIGYLNYLELNATRALAMTGSQMPFRTVAGTAAGSVSEFILNGNDQGLQIWDVTSGGNIRRIAASLSGSNYTFRLETDTLREFIAFDGSDYGTPEFTGKVANQDLHGTPVADYLIISHPAFLDQANRLADFHREHSNMTVFVTTPETIYNEFSSGTQDITAIRDFVRMMYNRAEPGREPKYLLLFGDASYDYKDRLQNNTNYVPAYESTESLSPTDSFVSDDYFGLLDPGEGQSANGELDLGVGRFPVDTPEEATATIDKVFLYTSQSDTVKNDWRNVVTFVADDQNDGGNTFINDSEDLAGSIETNYRNYNVDKIYSDAYAMESTPGGGRYPEVNQAINKRVEKGSLIMNYIGHGGEVGWAHERILEVPDIQGWRNSANMPVFVTATCEFSRFDDPGRVAAGEWVLLNGNGGGIALFTTTRLTFAGTNKSLLDNFYNKVFEKNDGQYMNLGDLLMTAKKGMGSLPNIHAFVLLGDPAMKMAYPELNVVTTTINSKEHTFVPDTLSALSVITVTGEVRTVTGTLASGFSGTVFPTVYDKSSEIWTKANQQQGAPVQFFLRKNPVYKGKVDVVNGQFTYTFIVPKDIALNYGPGKISYYARSAETDANGYDDKIQVGGYNNGAEPDAEGPEMTLYMNDRNFRSGGFTSQNPVLLADISDSSGVNTVGNGIGHDITAVLDNRTTDPMILNDYYVSDLNTYKSGSVFYPLSDLADGHHEIKVKVWDVYNNSTDATIEFVVASSDGFTFTHLMNYPNPMKDETTFAWETNQVSQPVDIELRIFSLNGSPVRTMRQTIFPTGFREVSFKWDGTQDNGCKISSGLYLYQVTMYLPDGAVKRQSAKLVVIR